MSYPLEFEFIIVPEGMGCGHSLGVVLVPEIVGWETKHLTLNIAVGLLVSQEETGDDLEWRMGNGKQK